MGMPREFALALLSLAEVAEVDDFDEGVPAANCTDVEPAEGV